MIISYLFTWMAFLKLRWQCALNSDYNISENLLATNFSDQPKDWRLEWNAHRIPKQYEGADVQVRKYCEKSNLSDPIKSPRKKHPLTVFYWADSRKCKNQQQGMACGKVCPINPWLILLPLSKSYTPDYRSKDFFHSQNSSHCYHNSSRTTGNQSLHIPVSRRLLNDENSSRLKCWVCGWREKQRYIKTAITFYSILD